MLNKKRQNETPIPPLSLKDTNNINNPTTTMNEIKLLLIETNHKYKEELSTTEINLFFSLYSHVYIMASN